jgi:hypothetical protein
MVSLVIPSRCISAASWTFRRRIPESVARVLQEGSTGRASEPVRPVVIRLPPGGSQNAPAGFEPAHPPPESRPRPHDWRRTTMNLLVKAHMGRWSQMAEMACPGCCCVPGELSSTAVGPVPPACRSAWQLTPGGSPPPSGCLPPGSTQGHCASPRDGPPATLAPTLRRQAWACYGGAEQTPGLAHSGHLGRPTCVFSWGRASWLTN